MVNIFRNASIDTTVKQFAFELSPVIADIYNASLRNGYLSPYSASYTGALNNYNT